MDEYARIERIPQGADCTEEDFHDIYEEASSVAGRVLSSMQALAGTTYCKGVQIRNLADWAKENGYWIQPPFPYGIYADRGSENEVYLPNNGSYIFKLNDFRYSDDNLSPFFERIKAHNYYFPECGYKFVGMSENRDGSACAVLIQPFITAERESTEEEIHTELQNMGFTPQYNGECFTNGVHDIYDARPNNVLMGVDGRLYFIDPIIYLSSEDTLNYYRNQSPRFK